MLTKNDLKKRIQNAIEKLENSEHKLTYHKRLGCYKIKGNHKRRKLHAPQGWELNIWHPETAMNNPLNNGDYRIHNHTADLESHILTGELQQTWYNFQPNPNGDWTDNNGQNHTLTSTEHRNDTTGNHYYLPEHIPHELHQVNELTITEVQWHPNKNKHISEITGYSHPTLKDDHPTGPQPNPEDVRQQAIKKLKQTLTQI